MLWTGSGIIWHGHLEIIGSFSIPTTASLSMPAVAGRSGITNARASVTGGRNRGVGAVKNEIAIAFVRAKT